MTGASRVQAGSTPPDIPPIAAADDPAAGLPSATQRVTDAITRGIRAGLFVPGQHLLEPDLVKRLGIGRGSLREALKHLAADGIVTLSRYRGAYIASLDRKSVFDLLDTLEPLTRLGARLAAEHCRTAETRERMRRASELIGAASRSGDHRAYLEQRRNFYDTVIDIGGNRELARTMPLSRTDLFRAQVETAQTPQQRARHAAGYAKIAQAIIDANPDAADRAVRRHFESVRRTMADLPGAAFPSFDRG